MSLISDIKNISVMVTASSLYISSRDQYSHKAVVLFTVYTNKILQVILELMRLF